MHLYPLIQDLAIILGVAAIVTYIFRLIQQPVVLGYIAAGLIVGPYTPPILSVVDTESVKIWAELGVIFLMFSLGLEFSFRKLAKVGASATVTGVCQIAFMVVVGYYFAIAIGWNQIDGLFLGCAIAVSSTTIIIKAFEELNVKSRKFAELTFGILIVEDLAAILMLVTLTNFATKSSFDATQLAFSIGKLILVVSSWILFGIYLVPKLVKKVASRGNDEMLTILATGLCLALVTLAAKFEYSVALGAFIMGSILAESREVHRIERLVSPLKDVFGAVFFVSVGMLLDPRIILDNFGYVMILSAVIIGGKIVSVTLSSLASGQSIKTSLNTGFSMAQIGEFSFIIAGLGQSLGVINETIYPTIVAASLVTTFATPYLIRYSLKASDSVEKAMPSSLLLFLNTYRSWLDRASLAPVQPRKFNDIYEKFQKAFFENRDDQSARDVIDVGLVPWDAHVSKLEVAPASVMAGKSLIELEMRERYGINVIAIIRGDVQIMAPGPGHKLFPGDTLVCFGSDADFARLEQAMAERTNSALDENGAAESFVLKAVDISETSRFAGKPIKDSGIGDYQCIVVGIERNNQRLKSPKSREFIYAGDRLWVIGKISQCERLINEANLSLVHHT